MKACLDSAADRRTWLQGRFGREGLAALLVEVSSGLDPNLQCLLDEHAIEAFGRGGLRLGAGLLLVPRCGGLRFRPDSPWEMGEAREAGLEPVDPRPVFATNSRWRDLLATLSPRNLGGWQGQRDIGVGDVELAAPIPVGVVGSIDETLESLVQELIEEAAEEDLERPETTTRMMAAPTDRHWRLVPAGHLLALARRFKTPHEIERIERSAAATREAMLTVARLLAAAIQDRGELWHSGLPLTVATLREAIDEVFRRWSVEQPEGGLIAPGAHSADPHHTGRPDHRLRVGEALIVDLFPCAAGVFSDCTRTFCLGPVSEHLARAAADVVEVKADAEAKLDAELSAHGRMDAWSLNEIVSAQFQARGWPSASSNPGTDRGFVHGLGHGVGFELHEEPLFSRDHAGHESGAIGHGDVITLEPGLYEPGGWGVRFEDCYVIEAEAGATTPASHARKLTQLPWSLCPKEFLGLAAASARGR